MTTTVIAESFQQTMAHLPTSVAIVATDTPAGPIGCTANAMLSLSLCPSSMVISLNTGSRTLEAILDHRVFSVNGLSWNQRNLCPRFAAGDPLRRFDGVMHEIHRGAPVLLESVVSVVCRTVRAIPVYDHTLLVGDVLWSRCGNETALVLRDGNSGQMHRLRGDNE